MLEEKTTLTSDISNNEPKYYIVNLSAINGLNSISFTLNAFADLHYRYSNSWFKWEWYSRLWTGYKFLFNKSLIDDYKLGKIDTNKFTHRLLDIFYFLKNNEAVENPIQLLEKTWNSIITWDEKSKERLNDLINLKKPVYFISNSNPLNIEKIICLFRESRPDINWEQPPEEAAPAPINIAPGFDICLSYIYKEFKEGTPGLIGNLASYFTEKGINLNDVELVSQYGKDLEKARGLGIQAISADEFFASLAIKKDQSVQHQQAEGGVLNSTTPQVERRPSVITPPGLFRVPASSNISAAEESQLQSSPSQGLST